ncbi:MAG TPA: DUF1405 domain-containing protein [Roseiflexaceae bacterium]|nr:DUF1405 domain-containing protein [Roseiflexaceae bacterium]
MERILRWTLNLILGNPPLFWAAVVANLLGTVVGGVVWYGPMILSSPLWALPFIPDCPLAALLGTVALFGLRAGRPWRWFYALAAFFCIKYGIWTIVFWLRQWSGAGVILPVEALLFVTHIGLLCEGLLLVPHIGELSLAKRLWVVAWFALSVFVDYGLGFHPPLVSHVSREFIFWLAAGLTAAVGAGLLLLPRRAPTAAPAPAPV